MRIYMNKRIQNAILFLISMAMVSFLSAQQEKPVDILFDLSLEELMNVTITTATKNPQKLNEVPSAITVITRSDIKNWNAKTVIDVLRFIPGFYVENYLGNLNIVSARGFHPTGYSKSAFLMLIDGRPANDIDFGNANFLMSTRNIKQIEIIRGPGSALYGANAFLGVINIITLNAKDIASGSQTGLLSDFTIGQQGILQTGINYSKNYNDEFSIYSGLEFSKQNKQVEKYSGYNSSFTEILKKSKNENYQDIDYLFKVNYKQFKFSSGFNFQNSQYPLHFGTLYFVDKEETDKTYAFADITYLNEIGEDLSFQIKSYINLNQVKEKLQESKFNFSPIINLNVDSLTRPNDVNEIRLGAEGQFTYNFKMAGIANKIITGLELRDERVDYHHTKNINSTNIYELKEFSNSTIGLFLQDKIELIKNFNFYLGGRFDYHSKYGNNFSPRISAIYNNTDSNFSLRANFGEAFKAPSFHQLYNHKIDPGFISPKDTLASLKPEKLKSFDIGGSYSFENSITTDLTVYLIEARNELVNSILSRPYFFFNRENTISKSAGIEFTTRIEKEISDFKIMPFLNLSYSEVKKDTSNKQSFFSFSGEKSNYRSNLKFLAGFNLTFQNFIYSNFVYHYIPKDDLGKLPGSFSDFNIGIRRTSFDIKVGIKNFFNETYYESRSIQLKRYFWTELSLNI